MVSDVPTVYLGSLRMNTLECVSSRSCPVALLLQVCIDDIGTLFTSRLWAAFDHSVFEYPGKCPGERYVYHRRPLHH